MATFHFELVSPDKLMFSGEAESVLVPGSEGDFVVLKDHAPVMASLKPGVIAIEDAAGKHKRIFVRGGFADVSPTGLIVLAETALPGRRTRRRPPRPGNPRHRGRPRRRARRAEAPVAGEARPPARAQGRDEAVERAAAAAPSASQARANAKHPAEREERRVRASQRRGFALRLIMRGASRPLSIPAHKRSSASPLLRQQLHFGVMPMSRTEVLSASNCASRPRMRLVFDRVVGDAVAAAAVID